MYSEVTPKKKDIYDINLSIKEANNRGLGLLYSNNKKNVLNWLFSALSFESQVTDFFIAMGKIYEEKQYHNAVFIGHDIDGNAASGYKMSIYENNIGKYQSYVPNSNPNIPFNHFGGSGRLFIFNNPLEMLSYLSIVKDTDWKKDNFITNFNSNPMSVRHTLEQYPQISQVVFACYHELEQQQYSGHSVNGRQRLDYKPHHIFKAMFPEHEFYTIQPELNSFRQDLKEFAEMESQEIEELPHNVITMY